MVRLNRISRRRGEHGVSMVEALVALAIFGVGLLALMQLSPRASHFGIQGRRISEAMNLAQAKVEELRSLPATHAELSAGTHTDTAQLGAFTRSWVVEDDTPVQGMRRVTLRVTFPSSSADSIATIVTYF